MRKVFGVTGEIVGATKKAVGDRYETISATGRGVKATQRPELRDKNRKQRNSSLADSIKTALKHMTKTME